MRRIDDIPDEVWNKFENIAVAVAVIAAAVVVGITLYLQATIGY